MKNTIKVMAFLLIAAMFFALCSCAADGADGDFALDYNAGDSDKVSFDGAEFSFFINSTYYTDEEYVLGYVVNTPFADLVLDRISNIESEYNVKMNIINTTNEVAKTLQTQAISGMDTYSAVQANSGNIASAARADLLYDISTLSDYINYLDIEKWGDVQQRKSMFWNGGLYGVYPCAWPLLKYNSTEGIIVVNEAMIKQLSMEDPREYIENNTWTWSKFEELMPIYAHTDSTGNYVYAYYSTIHWLFRAMQLTNGDPVVYRDGSDWALGVYTPTSIEAYERAYDWAFGEYKDYVYIEPGNVWTNLLPNFVDGKSVTAIINATQIYSQSDAVAYLMDDFGILHLPVGPNANEKTTGTTFNDLSFATAIPLLTEDPEFSAFILDKLYAPLPGYEDEQSIIDYLMRYYFYDERDIVTFINCYRNAQYEYRLENLTDIVINIDGSKTVMQWIDSYRDAYEADRVKYAVNMEDTRVALFGE